MAVYNPSSTSSGGASGGGPYAVKPTANLKIVGQRCGVGFWGNTQQWNGFPSFSQRQRILCPYGADAIQLVFPNFALSSSASEQPLTNGAWAYTATAVTYTGGTGYAVGDIDTFSAGNTTVVGPVKVQIIAVSAGVPTAVRIIEGGITNTPLGAGASPASTTSYNGGTGSGTGATATFTYTSYIYGMHIGIERVFGTFDGTTSTVQPVYDKVLYPTASQTLLVPSDNFLTTALIPVDIPIGGAFGLRMTFSGTAPQARQGINSFWAPTAPSANYESGFVQNPIVDFSIAGTITPGATNANGLLTPALVLGIPKKGGPTFMARGDSRLVGTATGTGNIAGFDPLDVDGNSSHFEKALSSTVNVMYAPWSLVGQAGESLGNNEGLLSLTAQGFLKIVAMGNPTCVGQFLFTNDLRNATSTLAQLKVLEQTMINQLRGLGVKYVYTETGDPLTTSTDSWATTGNQTLTSASTNMTARNAALVAGTWATYDFYVDNRSISESSPGSGKWAVNGTANYATGDGIHASPGIITLKAANEAAVLAANVTA